MRTRGRKSRGRRGRKREPQRAAEEGGGEDIPASRAEHNRVVRSRESRGAEQSHGGWSGIWSRTGLESRTERTVGVTVEWSSRCAEQSRADGRPRSARTDSRGAVACATAAAGLESSPGDRGIFQTSDCRHGKERTADGVKGKGDAVKVDQLRVERTKAVETTAAIVQAVAESPSRSTEYLILPSPNRRFKRTITSWLKGQHLVSGSFGSVYRSTMMAFSFAVKEVSLMDQGLNAKQRILQLEHEISLLSRLEHENIVQYFGTDKEGGKLYIFLELVTQGFLAALYQKYRLQDSQVSA